MASHNALFITGVGGFIGLRLAELCMARGIRVSGVDLDPRAVERARALGVNATLLGINDGVGLRARMAGAEAVVHTAAIVREHGDPAQFERVNVQGSRTVAEAARDCGVRSFVQLSSVMVYGFDYPDQVGEDGPLRGEGNLYCQTKIDSERAVLALNGPTFGVIVIRPGDVYGPGSVPWIARPLAMLKKRQLLLPKHGRGVINHVYVDNLVDGILLALEEGCFGEAINIADGEASSCADYFGQLAKRAGLPGPTPVATPLMRGLVWIMAGLYRLGLSADEVGPDTVRSLSRPHVYSIAKARRLLGYEPRVKLAEGLRRSQSFIEQQLARTNQRGKA